MNHIDHIFYINLDRRTDRRAEIEQELKDFDFPEEKITRFKAIEYEPGCIGCSKSHLEIYKLGKERNYENIIILEDDFKIVINKEKFHENLQNFFANYGEKFDVVMLSYNLIESVPINDLIGYCRRAQTTSGYIVNVRILPELINIIEESIKKLIETQQHWIYSIDCYWSILQQKKEWYYFIDRVGVQRPGYSDLAHKVIDYKC